ncbi:EAL domain-containing protein [Leifsonia sp. NPDC058230]|uniref:EAL domain-containing protein n=1 Tax=Leifsonia sp. NPDC058230 TaxID=3346391 RepID=UPI0036DD4787
MTGAREQLAADLLQAVRRHEIVPVVQPQIAVATGAVVGVEFLSRWRHPELGQVPPAVFIPLAEMSDAIHQLGRLMIRACCRFGASWQKRGTDLDVAVNVAPSQLATTSFYDALRDEIEESGVDPRRLTLEVTEATEIDDPATVAARLDALRELGIVISIDDFGTGHSSAGRAVELHATELKLDRRLVEAEGGDRVVEAAIVFAHERGMRTVGEGVETPEQLTRLRALGCDRAQGYFIAEPVSEDDFERWIAQRLSSPSKSGAAGAAVDSPSPPTSI